MERTMDYAAAELGIDRFELRKRNFIKAARDAVHDAGLGHDL